MRTKRITAQEAATVKARAQKLLATIADLLADKTLPEAMVAPLKSARVALRKSWADLAADATPATPAESLAAVESACAEADVLLSPEDSLDSLKYRVQRAVRHMVVADSPDSMDDGYRVCLRDMFPDAVVYENNGELSQVDFTVDPQTGAVTLGTPIRVKVSYVPDTAEYGAAGEAVDPNVGGGVDRNKIPASDFAGKNRSFPIVKPGDVSDAASSIGRAGADNYSGDELKRRIIAIAKRKGASYVAELPKTWRESAVALSDADESDPGAVLDGDVQVLQEKAVRQDGTMRIKLLSPGWGVYGYYGADTIQRDISEAFPAGTHMYANHPTEAEARARPERDIKDLWGTLTSDAQWDAKGPDGPGAYADARPMPFVAEQMEALVPDTGLSIRYKGKRVPGEAEGRKGPIITAIAEGLSVDFVTQGGRDGKVLQMMESRRRESLEPLEEGADVTEQELQEMREAQATTQKALAEAQESAAKAQEQAAEAKRDMGRMQDALRLRDARDTAARILEAYTWPTTSARDRVLAESVTTIPMTEEGALDTAALAERVKAAATAELTYLREAAGFSPGSVRDLGGSSAPPVTTKEEGEGVLAESFKRLGMSESSAKLAASGR